MCGRLANWKRKVIDSQLISRTDTALKDTLYTVTEHGSDVLLYSVSRRFT